MWPKYLPLATFAYKMFNTLNLRNYSPYELVFERKPKLLLNLETVPDIKVSGIFKDYCYTVGKGSTAPQYTGVIPATCTGPGELDSDLNKLGYHEQG